MTPKTVTLGKAGTLAEDVALASMAVLLAVVDQLAQVGVVDSALLKGEIDKMIADGGDGIGRGLVEVLEIFSNRINRVEKR